MRLLYLANLRLPTEKAYGIQIAKMCEAFAAIATTNDQQLTTNDKNIEVELVVPYRKNEIRDDLFEYYSVKNNFKFKKVWAPDFYWPGKLDRLSFYIKNIISALALSWFVIKDKADVIYSRDEITVFILSFFRNNVAFEAHKFPKYRTLFWRSLELNNVKVITITRALRDDIAKTGFRGEILVASDGVDLKEFDLQISKKEARSMVGLPNDKKIVMYTGHLFEWKGAGVLLEAVHKFKNDVLFVFVGGTEYDIEKFKKKAEGLNNVLILGQKSHKEIPIYLKAADVLVLPNSAKEDISKSYTSPLKMFEYMASGRPMVASDISSIREVLNNKNAILVSADDPDGLKSGIDKLLNDASFGEELANQARRDVENYTWTKRADSILSFLNQ